MMSDNRRRTNYAHFGPDVAMVAFHGCGRSSGVSYAADAVKVRR
jgi:hypothetical protein